MGAFNPINWIPMKRHYPGKKIDITLKKVKGGLIYQRKIEEGQRKTVERACLFKRIDD